MLARYFKLTVLLAGCLSCLIVTNSNAADKLYYGSYDGEEYPSVLKDSLKFNIVRADRSDFSEIQLLAENAMRAIVANFGDSTPLSWSGKSHYTLWEAEGFPGSNVNLQYDGGSLVDDDSASGGEAMKFSGPDTPRIIQTGPTYYQEYGPIQYTAEFRLKYVPEIQVASIATTSSTPVCSIMVVNSWSDTILSAETVSESDFIAGTYQTFDPGEYAFSGWNQVEFQIYWFGIAGDLYIDYVKVYDDNGLQIMSGAKDSAIIAYVSQDWTKTVNTEGDTVIYRWYVRDEPPSIDLYMPTAHIDSLLKEVSQERLGFQAFNRIGDPDQVHEYLLRRDPKDFCIDIFPMGELGHDTTGSNYQQKWNTQIGYLNFAKTEAENLSKDFWLVPQVYTYADTFKDSCDYPLIEWGGTFWCPHQRDPSQYELRLQTFLGLCYGADGIMYFRYQWWIDGNGNLLTGLYDALNDSTTYKWREIRDFIGPRIKVLSPIYTPLEWQGACLDDAVDGFVLRNGWPSYVDSTCSNNPADEPHWVQVGFFENDNQSADTSYFMLVNRECLETEGANYDVFVTKASGPYQIRDIYTDSLVGCVHATGDHFTVYLGPGEGKLFRLEDRERILPVPAEYPTIQAAIDAAWDGDTVLVAPGTYQENINFLGKAITAASHFIYDHNPATIEATIIDGSSPYNPDSASVVRFVSGEGSNSILQGFTITGGTGTSQLGPGRPEHRGGGVFCSYSSPTIINNLIIDNYIPDHGSDFEYGGGIGCHNSASPTIANNLILNNSMLGYDVGGGICFRNGGNPLIVNNTISGNIRGGIYVWDVSDPFVIANNTIANNTDFGIWANPNSYGITYNDVWNNDGYDFVNCPSGMGDTTWGTNVNGTPCDSFYNIIMDPVFVNPGSDYHLQEGSPCIGAGNRHVTDLPDIDFEGNPRISGCYVDIGAYEFPLTHTCGDANGDGIVNVGDVVFLVSYLYKAGPAPDPVEVGDANSDGIINVGDVVYLVSYLYKGGPPPCEPLE